MTAAEPWGAPLSLDPTRPTVHIVGLSGGKDSSALAIHLSRRPELKNERFEYFFCDTGAELPETYEYLAILEATFGKPIRRLNSGRDFDHWMDVYRGTLPSPTVRWCTRMMKIKPLEDWIDAEFPDHNVVSYVAIRADEPNREGYLSTKTNVFVRYPFREEGIDKEGVMRILEESGVGLPKYYEWRTRSGCYFCFFQRKAEWVGLAERHPDLFAQAQAYENKVGKNHGDYGQAGPKFTWSQGESLADLIARRDEIMAKHAASLERAANKRTNLPIVEILGQALDEDDDSAPCQVCSL